MAETEIILDYGDERIAEAIAKAVSPDNFKTPKGLTIKTSCQDGKVITQIKCDKTLPTLIATIDDLLACVTVAEKTINATKKLKKQ
ncbi:MAG: KEOPS complex subunit Pcc1 [Candidatus Bathyarchaeia archaeon]